MSIALVDPVTIVPLRGPAAPGRPISTWAGYRQVGGDVSGGIITLTLQMPQSVYTKYRVDIQAVLLRVDGGTPTHFRVALQRPGRKGALFTEHALAVVSNLGGVTFIPAGGDFAFLPAVLTDGGPFADLADPLTVCVLDCGNVNGGQHFLGAWGYIYALEALGPGP